MKIPPEPLDLLLTELKLSRVDLLSWGASWARAAPTVTLVPAFGLRAVPAPTRVALGLALGLAVAPALRPALDLSLTPAAMLALELVKGLPIAVGAALALWVALMAGGLIDNLRGAREAADLPHVEPGSTTTGALLAMLSAIAFLQSGGASRVAARVGDPGLQVTGTLARISISLTGSVELAVAVAAPLVVVSLLVETGSALIARAASPAYLQPLLAPLRSLVILGAVALLLDRISELLLFYAASAP
ncbi:MAG TPA: flagellar biosynthetic protein FliR [Polyangiaceae bacterium]